MKRPLYYLLCAIACTSMVSATLPMAAIADAIQPQETAELQAQADATNGDTAKAEDGTDTNTTADTVEDNTATSTSASVVNTESADDTTAATGTPTPSLRTQANSTPAAISATSQTTYAHSATATQNGVTFTVSWNDAPAGTATTFHVTQANGSSQAKARMDVPTYWDGGSQESVCDPSRPAWAGYYSLGTAGHDFTFDFTASGTYRIYFYFMDNDRNDPQNDKGIYYLRTTAEVTVNDAARPSVTQIVNNAVAQCRQQTNGSEYDMALWLHDWTLDQLEYDHSLNWCSAESGLTRHQGTCESYQRIYSKLLDAAGIANGRITGNGHTWNAVKIDGKWCQMDLTWDDTSDNWYGDLDQRHLYFGLTDELMAIAHSDHTANYQKDSYAHRSTDLSNNYFVRNGKADEWAEKYADRIQQYLDAKEESFSIDADNQLFPPSISGIQNGIIAYAMNQREWTSSAIKVEFLALSKVMTAESNKWTATYSFKVGYSAKNPSYIVHYHETISSKATEQITPVSYGHKTPTLSVAQLDFSIGTCKFLGWRCYRDSDKKWWATLPDGSADWIELNNGKLPDGCTYRLLPDGWETGWSTPSGNVHLFGVWNKTYTIRYHSSINSAATDRLTEVKFGSPISTLNPTELNFSNGSSAFIGWRCHRDSDNKWWANLPSGKRDWVATVKGELPKGCTYALLNSGFKSARTAENGFVDFYAIWNDSYTVQYRMSTADGISNQVTTVEYGKLTNTQTIKSLGFKAGGKTFLGWRCFRDSDQKWWVTLKNGRADWVALDNGKLPEGCSFRLLSDGWNTGWSTQSGSIELIGIWSDLYTVNFHQTEDETKHPISLSIAYGKEQQVLSIKQLNLRKQGKQFKGWICYRDYDRKWWVTKPDGNVGWLEMNNNQLPAGYSFKLLPDNWKTGWSTKTGDVNLYAAWI